MLHQSTSSTSIYFFYHSSTPGHAGGARPGLTVLHHHGQEADDHFGARPDEHLAFPTFLCIVDAFESIGQNVHPHHGACRKGSSECTGLFGTEILSSASLNANFSSKRSKADRKLHETLKSTLKLHKRAKSHAQLWSSITTTVTRQETWHS